MLLQYWVMTESDSKPEVSQGDVVEVADRGDGRDNTADDRDNTSAELDKVSDARDERANARDERAKQRDEARGGTDQSAASDRAGAKRDRQGGASNRKHAGHDRVAAATDRALSARERAAVLVDELTGGPTAERQGILEFERDITRARRTMHLYVLNVVDVDGLKTINDSHGHAAGASNYSAKSLTRSVAMSVPTT